MLHTLEYLRTLPGAHESDRLLALYRAYTLVSASSLTYTTLLLAHKTLHPESAPTEKAAFVKDWLSNVIHAHPRRYVKLNDEFLKQNPFGEDDALLAHWVLERLLELHQKNKGVIYE